MTNSRKSHCERSPLFLLKSIPNFFGVIREMNWIGLKANWREWALSLSLTHTPRSTNSRRQSSLVTPKTDGQTFYVRISEVVEGYISFPTAVMEAYLQHFLNYANQCGSLICYFCSFQTTFIKREGFSRI